jgi:hypothetical protein
MKERLKINIALSENGCTTLVVNFTDRNPMTFYGNITGHNVTFPASGRTAASDQ